MSKKTSSALVASKAKMQSRLELAKAELAVAQQREVFTDGAVYTVSVGKPGAKEVVQGTLLGQITTDKGALKLRFQVGSGMSMRLLDLSPAAVVVGDGEPVLDSEGKAIKIRTSGVVASIISKIQDRLTSFDSDLQEALAREQLVVGDMYTIKVGRGESRRNINAMLYAQVQDESGTKLRFFAGEGFDAEFYDGTPAMVVVQGAVEEDPAFDAAVDEAAQAEAEAIALEKEAEQEQEQE